MMTETFQIVVLGCMGGPWENNLSGYLFSPLGTNEWITLDAGSLLGGIQRGLEKGSFPDLTFHDKELQPPAEILLKYIKGYVISHAHLDHILGLVINSQIDDPKTIMGIDPTIDNLRDHIFNGRIWPNYGNEGVDPIKRYNYLRLPLHQRRKIPSTSMQIEAFLLSHPHSYPSSAFLIEYHDTFFLYVGDTSSDSFEKEKRLAYLWNHIAPLIRAKKLKGMMLECSYCQCQADQACYGHLDTTLIMQELHSLQNIAQTSLQNFTVVVTHRKDLLNNGSNVIEKIREEITATNDLQVNFIFPVQGERLTL